MGIIRKAIGAGLALLTAAGCKGMNPDDYRIYAGHAHNTYDCGVVRYEGRLGFNEQRQRMEYGLSNRYTDESGARRSDEYAVTAGTAKVEMAECIFLIIDLNSGFIEYRTEARK